MVAQETLNAAPNAAPRLGRSLNGFAHDILALGELQLRLLAVDCRDAKATATKGLILLASGAVLAFGLVPILLATIGLAFVEFADWSYTAAFGAAAGISLLAAVGLAWAGWKALSQSGSPFQRSKTEMKESLHWIKESLRASPSEDVDPL